MKKILLLFSIALLSFGQTPCLDAIANATGAIGEFIPQCEEDGSYSPIQCWWSTGYCWCVDEDGIEIPETAIASWDGVPNCNEYVCEGVSVSLEAFDNFNIDILISTENSNPDFACIYCGLVLMDNNDNIVAVENPYTANNFYGLWGGLIELRTLDIITSIDLPFEGQLHAVNGLMPNVNVDENFVIDPDNPIDMEDGDIPFTMCSWAFSLTSLNGVENNISHSLLRSIDILGRENSNNNFQLEIYNDGSVEKKYLMR